jgi:hypothetical protein
MPTLDQIKSSAQGLEISSPVARLVILSSTFGQCAQYALKEYKYPRQLPPWDARSNFCKTSSFLLKIEQMFCASPSLGVIISNERTENNGEVDYSRVGPLVYAHCLFHIGRCLLHHPFLMAQRLANLGKQEVPPLSFLSHALELYKSHAQAFTELIEEVKKAGYTPPGSFYAFFNTVAGVAHAILTQADDTRTSENAKRNFGLCLENLAEMSQHWKHAALMVGLREHVDVRRSWANTTSSAALDPRPRENLGHQRPVQRFPIPLPTDEPEAGPRRCRLSVGDGRQHLLND